MTMGEQVEMGASVTTKPATEAEMFDLLAERYAEPSHVILPKVRNATGFTGTARTADALVLELWPMHGMRLIGFEMKSSRSDWLRELRQPRKREAIAKFCDQWYVVAGDTGIVRVGELRPHEGLLEVTAGRRLRLAVGAPDVEAMPVTREFLAAIVRRAVTCSPHGKSIVAGVKERAERVQRDYRQKERELRNEIWNLKAELKAARGVAK